MKKIFLTVSRGWIARNLLQNDFYKILREKYKIVLLTPAYKDERFEKEFAHPNVSFLPLEEYAWDADDRFLSKLHKMLIWNPSVDLKFRYGILNLDDRDTPVWKYILVKSIFLPLSKITILRTIIRWFDDTFLQKNLVYEMKQLLIQEKPDLIICTHTTSDTETALIKAAKKSKIQVWTMPKSWDNLSNSSFRSKANRLVVWNEYMKERAMMYQNYSAKEIDVIGVTQYDAFDEKNRFEDYSVFCKHMGLSPERKTLFFGSEGKLFIRDPEIAGLIYEFIEKDELIEPCQLLIRPHYGYQNDEQKFAQFFGKPHVVVDLFNQKSQNFRDEWDYSEEFTNRFINSIAHSSVIINTCSTLSLDAAALDRPAINIMFDGFEQLPYSKSLVRWYDNDYYKEVIKVGGTQTVYNKEELRNAINNYLRNPAQDADAREKLRQRFCFRLDGKSGQRYAELVINFLEKEDVKK